MIHHIYVLAEWLRMLFEARAYKRQPIADLERDITDANNDTESEERA